MKSIKAIYEDVINSVNEAASNTEEFTDITGRKIKLKFCPKNEYDEYTVKVYIDGKYSEDATYYTDSKEDALETMKAMKNEYLTKNIREADIEEGIQAGGIGDEILYIKQTVIPLYNDKQYDKALNEFKKLQRYKYADFNEMKDTIATIINPPIL